MAAIQADLDNTQEIEGIRNEASFKASIKNATSLNKCSGHTGVPSRDGRLFLSTIKMFLSQIYLYEIPYSDTVDGNDPGGIHNPANGAPNANVRAQHVKRDKRAGQLLIGLFPPTSGMASRLRTNAFDNSGYRIWQYLNGPNVLYIPPSPAEIRNGTDEWNNITFDKLHTKDKNALAISKLRELIENYNDLDDDEMRKTESQKCEQLAIGVHYSCKEEALKIFKNLNYAATCNVLHLDFYQPHEPEFDHGVNPAPNAANHDPAFNANPQAGALCFTKFSDYIEEMFKTKIDNGIIRLKASPEANLIDPLPASPTGQNAYSITDDSNEIPDYLSMNDSTALGYGLQESIAFFSSATGGRPLRTCKNCGGIGHYEWNRERTERICPTPEGAVAWDVLSNIRYPVGVLAWNYSAKGGKGKGRGKGGRKGGRGGRGASPGGRGRGSNSAYEVQDEAATPDVSEATAAMTSAVVDDDDFWT